MKASDTINILGLAVILGLSLLGCSDKNTEISDNSQSTAENSPAESTQTESTEENSPAESTPTEPEGEPTFLIGLDGKPIYTSEISRLEDTDKTAETLTKDDLWARIYCDGFVYLKEPTCHIYNSYHNPEMFDEYEFKGEIPEKQGEWKRYYVGDEICGLKIKKAASFFYINDYENYTFRERYYESYDGYSELYSLEGTVTLEGFLEVNSRSLYEPDGGLMMFYPTENKLPVFPKNPDWETGYSSSYIVETIFNTDYRYISELGSYNLGNIKDTVCDMNGVGIGDLAFVRATLSIDGTAYTLDGFELIENVDHIEDSPYL
ncbi:MAG: hypothetical protein HDT42_06875 [Ruminococcaceae bacterium]|nr:hypothetical protein [Oscillospiraceae bacterium]